jgi:AraC-like DNA-binding protein
VVQALAAIEQRACEPRLRLSDIASAIGISRWILSCLLKRHTGFSFPEHVNRRRIETAQYLLATTARSVKEVAFLVGYSRPSDLSRHFRRYVGLSPNDWRIWQR